MKKVEQISKTGKVVLDFDQCLSVTDIRAVLARHVQVFSERNPFEVRLANGSDVLLCVKNISYLGHPHPIHKKRIQIPRSWQRVLRNKNAYLLGVYQYDGRTLFALFDTARYRENNLNNSSAHVHSIDLLNAVRYGEFKKTDKQGNAILTFTEDQLSTVLARVSQGDDVALTPELALIDAFAENVPVQWSGKRCYREMIEADFPDKLQAEWPGFYLEFRFSVFLQDTPEWQKVCAYVKQKKKGEALDFDLQFTKGFLGDLKMHSVTSSAVLGNDQLAVERALKRSGRFWYVIVRHVPVLDRDNGYAVTKFWNAQLSDRDRTEKDPLSYGGRMKFATTLQEVVVAEVNVANQKYLRIFAQGKNSNGKERAPKVQISSKDQDNFVIYRRIIGGGVR